MKKKPAQLVVKYPDAPDAALNCLRSLLKHYTGKLVTKTEVAENDGGTHSEPHGRVAHLHPRKTSRERHLRQTGREVQQGGREPRKEGGVTMATLWDITEKSVGMQTAAKIIKYIAESTSAVANNGELLERAATLEALGMKFAEDCRELIDAINEYEQSKAEAENIAREVIAERQKMDVTDKLPPIPPASSAISRRPHPVPPVPEHITDTNLDDEPDEPADIPEYTEAENTDLGISILIKDEAYNND